MGLILSMRLFENMLLNAYDEKPYAKSPLLEDWAAARRDAQAKIADYSIAATNESVVVGTLSGGNQQKIVVARELDRGCRMLIACLLYTSLWDCVLCLCFLPWFLSG